jgi:hypothetical protein
MNDAAVRLLGGTESRVLVVRGADDFSAAERMINLSPQRKLPVAIIGVIGGPASALALSPLAAKWPTERRCAIVTDTSAGSAEFVQALSLAIPNFSGMKITLKAIDGKPRGLAFYARHDPAALGLWVPWWAP